MPEQTTSAGLRGAVLGGRYRLDGLIGRGGMASVYRATDQTLGRDVAVKVLHGHLADDEALLDRFRREAQAVAGLSHRSLVTVHDWGEDHPGEDTLPYIVMELVEGDSLRDVLRVRGRVSPAEALTLLAPAAEGLAQVHDAGLIHRDVKPENILYGPDGVARVSDFGLAAVAGAGNQTFGEDTLVGSPRYLSPESVRAEPLSARADVYALGVILFECLTGRPPFEADSPYGTAVAHTRDRVPAPSSLVRGVPPEVDAVVRRATHPDPAARYPDAGEFADALYAAVPDGPAVVDARDGRHDTVVIPVDRSDTVVAQKERPRRRRWPRLLAVLGALVLLGLGGWLLYDQVLVPLESVPEVVGDELEAARLTLEEAGFEVAVAPEEEAVHSTEVPAGAVAAQEPTGDARRGSTVTLVPSLGPRQVTVPTVAGFEEAAAVDRLEDEGLEADVSRVFHDEVPAGQVIGTDPPATTTVDEGSTVEVAVSKGPAPVDVPEVRELDASVAMERLEERGLVGEITEQVYHDSVPEGGVVEQSPAAGTAAHRGDTVSLTVSRGGEPFAMPDVRGMQAPEARADLEGRGLVVEITEVDTLFPWRRGEVDQQDPLPDTQVRRGDTVTLFVWS